MTSPAVDWPRSRHVAADLSTVAKSNLFGWGTLEIYSS